MLRLNNITKDYKVADTKVHALKGLSISFRQNEFVSVLGPSGCGKTTLLNIVGGLDKYTAGDLFIGGVSTKTFGDKEWDVYRNHRIGFVFQSYNLIPHQTVLKNVELALTISGMSKAERVQKAKNALIKVGLESEINKRPNQLSGGQSQRVAIARALVNDPDILLADEPTGALDTETSKQIMDLIKEIANDRLVIMVTHNPELAEQYSTRIIRLLDGNLLSDSNPFSDEEEKRECEENKTKTTETAELSKTKSGKSKMSFWTAFKLSLNNLFSKRSRTIMTSIAGSIGIIGISLVLAFSYGIQGYITKMQNDMLSGNPITISQSDYDLTSLMANMGPAEKSAIPKEAGYTSVRSMIESLYRRAGIQIKNDFTQSYIDYILEIPDDMAAAKHLDYGIDVTNNIFTNFTTHEGAPENNISLAAIRNLYTWLLKNQDQYEEFASFVTGLTKLFRPMPIGEDYLRMQYNFLYGEMATKEDEIMIVLTQDRQMNDLLLAQLGYFTQNQFIATAERAINQPYNEDDIKEKFSFQELIGKEFVWYNNDTVFKENTNPMSSGMMPFTYNAESEASWKNGTDGEDFVTLKIVGIIEAKDNLSYATLSSGLYYTQAFREFMMQENENSKIAQYYKTNNITNLPLIQNNSITTMVPAHGFKAVDIEGNTVDPKTDAYEDIHEYEFSSDANVLAGIVMSGIKTYEIGFAGSISAMSALFGSMMGASTEIYGLSLQELTGGSLYKRDGVIGFETLPVEIALYSRNFEEKQELIKYLDRWNSDEDIELLDGRVITAIDPNDEENGRAEIKYTDTLSLIIGMLNELINIITIALIGFTSLALVVSCVMIGIITYVSVVERTKEIGVIRSLGGRKRDVGYLFNAETFILGAGSGLIGIVFTWFVSFIINLIVSPLIGISIAVFPIEYAAIMLVLSIGLTLISGLIPSRSAAKKDPVVALRTE